MLLVLDDGEAFAGVLVLVLAGLLVELVLVPLLPLRPWPRSEDGEEEEECVGGILRKYADQNKKHRIEPQSTNGEEE